MAGQPIYDVMGNFTGYFSYEEADVPPKADAAPKTNKKNVISGLMEALNRFERELVPDVFEVANEYSIEFIPASLGDSKIIRPGKDKDKVPFASAQTASSQLNPETQSMDTSMRTWSILAGTPIVQVIDQIVRNSSYITDQAKVAINEDNQKTVKQKPIGGMTWYKISVQTTPIKYDNKRRDFAYQIKYVVSAYGINNMLSEYFPDGRYRGLHKSYNYWFTGQNTEIIGFEQEFNKLYRQIISDPDIGVQIQRSTDNREIVARMYQAASEQSSQGAKGRTNEIGASAADYLYSPADQGKVKLRLVGDPAWLQQGEASTGIDSAKFSFSAFNADGTINFDASEVVFDINWNRAVDYNLATGIADTASNNVNGDRLAGKPGAPKENITYRAVYCKSYFNKGRFEQELEGRLFMVPLPTSNSDSDRLNITNAAPNVRKNTVPTKENSIVNIFLDPKPSSSLAKGVQQLLNPPTQLSEPSLSQLQSSPIYIQARRGGATPQAALDAARSAFAAGTNNYSGVALPGIRTTTQIMAKDP